MDGATMYDRKKEKIGIYIKIRQKNKKKKKNLIPSLSLNSNKKITSWLKDAK